MNVEELREKALESILEVRAKIGAAQCVFFKNGIGLTHAQLEQYDKMLDRTEMKIMFDSVTTKCDPRRYIARKEDDNQILELVMFIQMMSVISKGFETWSNRK